MFDRVQKTPLKSFNRSFCEFNIFSFSSHLVKYFFSFYFVNFYFYQYSKTISSFVVEDFYFYSNEYWYIEAATRAVL